MNNQSTIYKLKIRGFKRMEKNSYADEYGLNVVFNEGKMTLTNGYGEMLLQTAFEQKIMQEIIKQRKQDDL